MTEIMHCWWLLDLSSYLRKTRPTQGLLKREIADRLGVRHKTVDNHLQSVYKKLNIHSLAELKTMEDFIFG